MRRPTAPEVAAAAARKTIIKPDYGKDGSMRQGGQRLASAGLRQRDGGSSVGDVVVEVASAMAMAAALVAVVTVVAMLARSSRGSPACRHQRRPLVLDPFEVARHDGVRHAFKVARPV
jgi:hypothetical protein